MDRWMVKPIRQTPRRLLRGQSELEQALVAIGADKLRT